KKFGEEAQTWKRILERGVRSLEVLRKYVLARLNEASTLPAAQRDKIYTEIRRLISDIKKARPDDWRTIYLEALLEEKMDNSDAAAQAYEEVLRLVNVDNDIDTKDKAELEEQLHSGLASLYTDAKRYDKAIEQCQWLLQAHPQEARYRLALVSVYTDA